MRYIFDRRWTPFVATLLVGQSLAYTVLVRPPREDTLAVWGALAAIMLGAVGVALVILRRRWTYGRIIAFGWLWFFASVGSLFAADAIEFLRPLATYLPEPFMVVFTGDVFAGLWQAFHGPFIPDKSRHPAA